MSLVSCIMVATFTSPESIGVNPLAMLWMLPLTAAVAIVYKATKLPIITTRNFIKETFGLVASIVTFVVVTAVVLIFLAWFFTE